MSGPHRNPDKLNSIGIVVVGICGAVLVYVSIVALQAFYMNDSSEVQTMADYGGQDIAHRTLLAQQTDNLTRYESKPPPQAPKDGELPAPQTYAISIDDAIPLIVEGAKKDAKNLVPSIGPAIHPTVEAKFGRPRPLTGAPVAPPGAGATATPAGGADAGATAGGGATAPMTPTAGQGPGGGAPPGAEGRQVKDPAGGSERVEPAPKVVAPPAPPKAAPAQPKTAPAQPKAGGATTPAQPKAAPAQPKGGATPTQPKGGAPAPKQPAQPKKGNG